MILYLRRQLDSKEKAMEEFEHQVKEVSSELLDVLAERDKIAEAVSNLNYCKKKYTKEYYCKKVVHSVSLIYCCQLHNMYNS